MNWLVVLSMFFFPSCLRKWGAAWACADPNGSIMADASLDVWSVGMVVSELGAAEALTKALTKQATTAGVTPDHDPVWVLPNYLYHHHSNRYNPLHTPFIRTIK